MARFDVYRTSDHEQIVLDCQSNWLDHLDSRFVVPLVTTQPARETKRLHPVFEVRGQKLIMATHLAAAISVNDLGGKIGSLSDQHFAIMDALDMLISGY
jgi:toxin CcdB